MAKLNRSQVLKAVNQSLAESGKITRVSFNSEWREYRVSYLNEHGVKTFAPCDGLVETIEAAIQISGWTN